jgi:hypothetical protein
MCKVLYVSGGDYQFKILFDGTKYLIKRTERRDNEVIFWSMKNKKFITKILKEELNDTAQIILSIYEEGSISCITSDVVEDDYVEEKQEEIIMQMLEILEDMINEREVKNIKSIMIMNTVNTITEKFPPEIIEMILKMV